MAKPVTRTRRSARRIFVLLGLLAAIGCGGWWMFLRDPGGSAAPTNIPAPEPLTIIEDERPLMGTLFKIVVYGTDEEAAREAIEAAFRRGLAIETICSDYNPASELSGLNASEQDELVTISPTLAAVLAHAHETADVTEGLYDPTLGALTSLWRQSRDTKSLPAPETLAAARETTGWRHLEVNLDESTATIRKAGLKIDLGGVAKGFAADDMFTILQKHGFTRALIAAGGDVRLGDPPPGAPAWRVGLRTFGPEAREFIQVANCAVSTSGDLQQFVEIEGKRYAHIINPATGLGLTGRIAATIIAPTATQSDPLATFACIAPDTALQAFMGGEIHCRILTYSRGEFQDRRSRQFPRVDSL